MISDIISRHGLETFGRFYGVYYGIVKSLKDPDGVNRLLVYIPEVKGSNSSPLWAIPRGVYSGKGYGMQILPQVEDQVVITFRHGHPRYPVWEFSNFGEDEKPEEFKETSTFGFITPNGTQILIKETEDGEQLLVKSKEGVLFQVDDTGLKLGKETDIEFLAKGDTTKSLLNELSGILQEYFTEINAKTQVPLDFLLPGNKLKDWGEKLNELLAKYS